MSRFTFLEISIFAFILSNSSNGYAVEGTYEVEFSRNISSQSRSVGLHDLDDDDYLDLVVADGSKISVALNGGNGRYASSREYRSGSSPVEFAIVDIERDGDFDIAVANKINDGVVVLKNDGNGRFNKSINVKSGLFPVSLSIGDFNKDGLTDLAVLNNNKSYISLLMNTGNGTFNGVKRFETGTGPRSISTADIDSDGHLDMIVANGLSNNISVLYNNGIGETFKKINSSRIPSPAGFEIGDVNGDQKPDIVYFDTLNDNVEVMINKGNRIIKLHSSFGIEMTPVGISLGDFDKDKDLDIVVVGLGVIGLHSNNGKGEFVRLASFQIADYSYTMSSPIGVASGDIDNDKDIDIVVAYENDKRISLLNSGNGTFVIRLEGFPQPLIDRRP